MFCFDVVKTFEILQVLVNQQEKVPEMYCNYFKWHKLLPHIQTDLNICVFIADDQRDKVITLQAVTAHWCCDTWMLMFLMTGQAVSAELCKRQFSSAGLTTVASYSCWLELTGGPPVTGSDKTEKNTAAFFLHEIWEDAAKYDSDLFYYINVYLFFPADFLLRKKRKKEND